MLSHGNNRRRTPRAVHLIATLVGFSRRQCLSESRIWEATLSRHVRFAPFELIICEFRLRRRFSGQVLFNCIWRVSRGRCNVRPLSPPANVLSFSRRPRRPLGKRERQKDAYGGVRIVDRLAWPPRTAPKAETEVFEVWRWRRVRGRFRGRTKRETASGYTGVNVDYIHVIGWSLIELSGTA